MGWGLGGVVAGQQASMKLHLQSVVKNNNKDNKIVLLSVMKVFKEEKVLKNNRNKEDLINEHKPWEINVPLLITVGSSPDESLSDGGLCLLEAPALLCGGKHGRGCFPLRGSSRRP